MVIGTDSKTFEAAVAEAAARLVSVRHEKDGAFITTPLMYPSGGSVIVSIDRSPPHFRVSDYGFSLRECELMGVEKRRFTSTAAQVAADAGVELTQDGAFTVLATIGQLEGAIKTVAGCASETAVRIAAKLHDRQRADVGEIVYSKLVRVYGKTSVNKHIEFKGASQTDWQIDFAVKYGDSVALFETVTPYFPAVAATLAKFGDIRLLENPPTRTAVLSSRDGFGTWITALAQNAHIVHATAADTVFGQVPRQ